MTRIAGDHVEWAEAASGLLARLPKQPIGRPPGDVSLAERIAGIGNHSVPVPASQRPEEHAADGFRINLPDAIAHGDARNVVPVNVPSGRKHPLAGFPFGCSQKDRADRRKIFGANAARSIREVAA